MVQAEGYPRGSVRRIKLKDFMSFVGTMVVDAGSRVNVIEGPNGSGKSSLVTALCLGLAGPIKALGRQTQPEEMVRYGCSAFELEVTLSGGPGKPDIVVQRRTELGSAGGRAAKRRRRADGQGDAIAVNDCSDSEDEAGDRATGRSASTQWRIDGRAVAEARVKELVRSLGIHFDNLCQFLPQERVSEFTNLSATQLLESTEESIGNGELLQQHKDLTQRSAELKRRREELQRTRDRLERVEADQAAARPEYDRLQRRNALRKQVEKLKQKIAWLEKQQSARRLEEAEAKAAAEQREVDAAKERQKQAEGPLNARLHIIQARQREAAALRQVATAKEAVTRNAMAHLRRLERPCKDTAEQLEGLVDKSEQWRAKGARLQREVQDMAAELQNMRTELPSDQAARLVEIPPELQQASAEWGVVDMELKEKTEELGQMDAQLRALQEAERRRMDRQEQRLRKLEEVQPGSRELYEWIIKMRGEGRFRRRVLGPVLMEISPIADPTWAGYVEQLITEKNLAAIVVEDMQDNNMVQDWLSAKAGPRSNSGGRAAFMNKILLVRSFGPVDYPNGPARQYGAYGVTHTVDQLFESQDLIKRALVDVAGINTAYVAGRETEGRMMEQLLENTPVRRVFTPTMYTTKVTSQYDPTYRTYKIDDAKGPKLLADNVAAGDAQAERQQREQLTTARGQLAAQIARLNSQRQMHVDRIAALRDEQRRILETRNAMQQRLASTQRELSDRQRRLARHTEEGDPMASGQVLGQKLRSDVAALMEQAIVANNVLADQQQQQRQLAAVELSAAAAQDSLPPLQRAVDRAQAAVQAAQANLSTARQAVAGAREDLRDAEVHANDVVGPRGPTVQMRTAWAEWPDDPDELEQLLRTKEEEMAQAQADLRGDEAAVLEAWARREVDMAELRQLSAAGTSEVETCAEDLDAKKNAWLPALRSRMAAINESVVRHFAAIGCAGEVVLREAGDAFEQYAAEIRVKYRPTEPLRPLNRNHHSGGERSVATMLYLMALQGVTTTPFRVVDEINQGMDSRNERKVFNLLVECSSRPDTPQCFLLTPKLISNLCYNDNVRVLCLKYAAAGMQLVPPGQLAHIYDQAEAEEADAGPRTRVNGAVGAKDQQANGGLSLGVLGWSTEDVKALVLYGKKFLAEQE